MAKLQTRVSFDDADLRGATFEDASLSASGYYTSVNFRDADLRGATFEDASLSVTYYGTIDFTGASVEGSSEAAPDTIVTNMQIGVGADPDKGTIINADGDCYTGSRKVDCVKVPLEDFLSDDDD